MLKRLHIQNWRSLRDVVIDELTPITVFIGANSSGKTNIMDALRFVRDIEVRGLESAVYELGYQRILTDALKPETDRTMRLGLTYRVPHLSPELLQEDILLRFDQRTLPFWYSRQLQEGQTLLEPAEEVEIPTKNHGLNFKSFISSSPTNLIQRWGEINQALNAWKTKRWQILSENFNPPDRIPRQETGNRRVMEADGRNMVHILEYVVDAYPELWFELLEELRYIFPAVTELRFTDPSSYERRVLVYESPNNSIISAPTVSFGTRRSMALLAAMYALNMPAEFAPYSSPIISMGAEASGLIVAEEIDAGLNPGVLQRLVEQLRVYTEGEHPRQILLTTHNPRFLDYFEPEEVRVVSRDEQGFTQVERIPDYIREIWLDKYGLGEVWMTNSLGGLAE